MNKLDMLYVRACKSANPQERLKTLYSRFYLPGRTEDTTPYLVNNLCRICEEYKLLTLSNFINSMRPGNVWKYQGSEDDDPTLAILISAIRCTAKDQFPGLISPSRFAS